MEVREAAREVMPSPCQGRVCETWRVIAVTAQKDGKVLLMSRCLSLTWSHCLSLVLSSCSRFPGGHVSPCPAGGGSPAVTVLLAVRTLTGTGPGLPCRHVLGLR